MFGKKAGWRTREAKKLLKEHSKTLSDRDRAVHNRDWESMERAEAQGQELRNRLRAEYRKGQS